VSVLVYNTSSVARSVARSVCACPVHCRCHTGINWLRCSLPSLRVCSSHTHTLRTFTSDILLPRSFALLTFPRQVILRNFHVHNVCTYQLYRPSHTICRVYGASTDVCFYACSKYVWGLCGKACSPTMVKRKLCHLN